MWRSPATSFVGYRAPGSIDRLLGSGRTRRPHAFEQLVDRCLVRHRPYLRRLRLRLLHREQVDHLAPAPHRLVLRQHAGVGALTGWSRARWCRWARRASAAWVSTNGSAAHRHEPDPASEVRPGTLLSRGNRGQRTKEATMTIKLVALVLLCLMTGTAVAQESK